MKKILNKTFSLMIHFFILLVFFFGHKSFASKNDFLLSMANQQINIKHDQNATKRLNDWERLIFHSLNKNTGEKLKLVNDFFNQMKWAEDEDIWDSSDYWATPMESLLKNSGDCEDFSIAKYYTLLAMDIPAQLLRITYVILDNKQGHMVLFYYPEASPGNTSEALVLDNMRPDILPKSERSDIKYMFSFNEEGLWLKGNNKAEPDEKNIIKKWAQMVQRIEQE